MLHERGNGPRYDTIRQDVLNILLLSDGAIQLRVYPIMLESHLLCRKCLGHGMVLSLSLGWGMEFLE